MIVLEHILVPARDKEVSAHYIADVLGLEYLGLGSTTGAPVFARVRVGPTTLDFTNADSSFNPEHYAFQVDDQQLDEILAESRFAQSHQTKRTFCPARSSHSAAMSPSSDELQTAC